MLPQLWKAIYDKYQGDPGKLTLLTMAVLLVTEIPIYAFTALDLLGLPQLYKYRLHYAQSVSDHLGKRVYPPWSVIKETAKVAEFNLIFAYMIPGYLGIKMANKLGIFVYDTDEKVSYARILKETFLISVVADVMFYGIHRIVHLPQFYQTFHKQHHEFKYSMALAHHYMTFHEALLFSIPQALPPILLIPFFGRMHLMSMWMGMVFTQVNAILGHAGWDFFSLPDWFPFLRAGFHDFHHVDYSVNFAANYEFTDKLFGTWIRAPMADSAEIASRAVADKAHDYVTHAVSKVASTAAASV